MPPASAFRHPVSQPGPEHSGTGLGPLFSVPDWFQHRHFCSFRYLTDRMPDSPTFRHLRKGYSTPSTSILLVLVVIRDTHAVHVQTAGSEKFKSDLPSTSVESCWWCNSCCMKLKKPESRRKVSPASAFLPIVSCLSPASAFRHQGSIRYRWPRIISALPSYAIHTFTFTYYSCPA